LGKSAPRQKAGECRKNIPVARVLIKLKLLPSYDFIIAGAGCAGLSLAVHLIRSGKFDESKVLLVDRDPKNSNDRTWCFWESGPSFFEEVVYRKWGNLDFFGDGFSGPLDCGPYSYKMIRGIDFYNYCLDLVRSRPNFTIVHSTVDELFSDDSGTGASIGGQVVHARYIFNSILFKKPELSAKEHWLLQHFRGWIIRTEKNVFDPLRATLMDFRVPQNAGTTFCYVLPFSAHTALVEYTVFSPHLLEKNEYEEGLKNYLREQLNLEQYHILETESGVIPMTDHAFPASKGNIIQIGTAGGQTKASSGYTFRFIQKHSAAMVAGLIRSQNPFTVPAPRRFRFYDSVLLRLLNEKTLEGSRIFTGLFRGNKASQVLKFLDNETSLSEELLIINSLPKTPFIKAALKQIF
jgi:lycopene beta-cyclase